MTPSVSIVMPFRDAADTLDECLESIAAQSLSSWELVAVDDGSRDGAREALGRRALEDPRIRILPNPGRGLVAALNAGLRAARAELVARMDADDRMLPGRLAAQVEHLERHPQVTLVACRVEAFPRGRLREGMREYLRWQNACITPVDMREEIYVEAPMVHSSVMFRRSRVLALGGYREGDFPEDYDLWLRLARAGDSMSKQRRVLHEWRQRPHSLSRTDRRYRRAAFDRLRATYLATDPRLATSRPLAIWGAGRRTRRRARALQEHGLSPVVWVDIDPRKIGNRVGGIPVVDPGWLAGSAPDALRPFVLSYVASHGARTEIGGYLRRTGYERGRDYLMVG
ncbi:MAG: glycosyltransferase [Gammaproteobacteria bacterium]|nr:glycosyltransferase [Gammaproteobacteria bacterium]NIR82033.1 glycosyltransferase [Gammaproteobacteria bacterium]NIR89261.1 glycosyltransferase [Gammaproteobacteria bacterium]NIU03143.1 glycosyltransferase [Gammaproteobacteria bacterium]NIV50659.1 glycosyltransferase [Gammaproteobacteria bacterium]